MLFTSNSKLTKPKPLKFSRDFNETVIKLTILNFGFFSRPSFHSIVKIQTLSLFSFLSFLSFFLFFFSICGFHNSLFTKPVITTELTPELTWKYDQRLKMTKKIWRSQENPKTDDVKNAVYNVLVFWIVINFGPAEGHTLTEILCRISTF